MSIYKFEKLFKWYSGKPVECIGGSIPVYGSNGIIGWTNVKKYNNKIILGRVGAYCGSVEYCEGDFNATDNTLITECNEDLIIYKYAYYMLKLMHLNLYAGGSAQPLITQSLLRHIACDLPNIDVQNKIADILSNYDDLIEKNNHKITILEEQIQELYKEWFVRFRFPGYEKIELVNGLPKGWSINRIGECCENVVVGGDAPNEFLEKRTEEYKYPIFSNGIVNDGLYGYSKTFKVSKQSVTVSARGTVGFVCLRNIEYTPIVRLISLIPKDYIKPLYFYQTLKYVDLGGNGTSQQQLTAPMIMKRKMLLAEQKVINMFDNITNNIFKEINKLKDNNNNISRTMDLLLPRLMSGKLEVKG